ncbi:MAG: DUF29 domain-containing protein [Symploca sp. SIO3C6]|uniref:DUF29 domain-containing protein n=1 Tax=Symploca sp. SIO1C4 TaxID=2607765 RepID=A0A6B3N881_9CYAN|nr:DUF29 domain-containing protein [Symploca sp. SIO3C6]NER29329.1 DUF29 domain-containing protein [Symploca sp. SIO1C4]NET07018.1 DUF29 domain-containing protein [Symploca sp. SIO2B6]
MEELLEIKQLLHQGKVAEALVLVEELEEMSKSDKLNKIFSYGIILLLHLIKKSAENRTTKSWETSIYNSAKQIKRTNKRHKTKGYYLSEQELQETLQDAYESALRSAALEAFEGIYEAEQLNEMVKQEGIITMAMDLILEP